MTVFRKKRGLSPMGSALTPNWDVALLRVRKLGWSLRRPHTWKSLRQGIVPTIEHLRVLRSIKPAFVVDAGANRGQFSMAARESSPQARIVAFEPLSAPANALEEQFARDSRHEVIREALGSEPGFENFSVTEADDSSSLLTPTDAQTSLYPQTRVVRTEKVRVSRLAESSAVEDIPRPSLLKIDVQGAELDLLEGAAEILPSFDYILVELSMQELYAGQPNAASVIAWLDQEDFELADLASVSIDRDKRAVQADFLFAQKVAL